MVQLTNGSAWEIGLVSMATEMRTSLLLCNNSFTIPNYMSKNETSHSCLENLNHFDSEQQPQFPMQVEEERGT